MFSLVRYSILRRFPYQIKINTFYQNRRIYKYTYLFVFINSYINIILITRLSALSFKIIFFFFITFFLLVSVVVILTILQYKEHMYSSYKIIMHSTFCFFFTGVLPWLVVFCFFSTLWMLFYCIGDGWYVRCDEGDDRI